MRNATQPSDHRRDLFLQEKRSGGSTRWRRRDAIRWTMQAASQRWRTGASAEAREQLPELRRHFFGAPADEFVPFRDFRRNGAWVKASILKLLGQVKTIRSQLAVFLHNRVSQHYKSYSQPPCQETFFSSLLALDRHIISVELRDAQVRHQLQGARIPGRVASDGRRRRHNDDAEIWRNDSSGTCSLIGSGNTTSPEAAPSTSTSRRRVLAIKSVPHRSVPVPRDNAAR